MSEETQITGAEAATEEQPADETPREEEIVAAVVAADAEKQAPNNKEEVGSRATMGRDEKPTASRVEGPANFNRAKQGNQRRNPRHVGNDVRIDEIDYKNVQILSRFVDNYGRIHNRRKTRVNAKMQRKVTRAIKRARHLALMPYTGEHIRITGRRGS